MRLSVLACGLLLVCGCNAASPSLGLSAKMRIPGAQFVPGAMPEENGGPAVATANLPQNTLVPGEVEKPLRASLGPSATAAIVGLDGDTGYWIIPAGAPDVEVPNFPTVDPLLAFSAEIAPGEYTLRVQAVDAAGLFGAPFTLTLRTVDNTVLAPLRITLKWDTQSDLDLRAVDPQGIEIWSRNVNSWQRPPLGTATDANDWQVGGLLDFDSNASCVIDGRREENITWQQTPPSGHYIVRVDTQSLCGQAFAHWRLEVRRGAEVLLTRTGIALPEDTRAPHEAGAGALAAELDLP